ncbi:hypothetical protein [Longimicrobium sp.]|uniref:hypothetical protein n=1 Tax=Longimicrobium sp. TaxID=2029185 RepID=UPI002C8F9A51|nr:hypothetical protein [Longimicrobium sp.]HSU15831.1 hypothetical protein [Longimicrobium sp.]
MRISHISVRAVFAAALAALLSGLAPAAAAQDLVPLVGKPIAYRVSMPAQGWNVSTVDDKLMVGRDSVIMIVSATDLVALQGDSRAGTEADRRRILTARFMGSDSIMMALMTRVAARATALEQEGLVQEIRTLGGQRAAYIRDRKVQDGRTTWRQVYLTVKDGIMYLLVFVAQGENPDMHKDLFDRVHQSFVLAETPK